MFEVIKAKLIAYGTTILFSIIAVLIAYIVYLEFCVKTRDVHISSLQVQIVQMETDFQISEDKRKVIEVLLSEKATENVKLEKEGKTLKEIIKKRPPAKECGEALSNIGRTAKEVAESWNAK